MTEPRGASPTRRGLFELACWCALCGGFLWIYVVAFGALASAIVPHLRLVALLVVAQALVRVAFWKLPIWTAGRVAFSSAVLTITLLALMTYYALVIAGLQSWGRVITWDLIRTYSMQAQHLFGALGLSLPLVVTVLVLFASSLYWLVYRWSKSADWTRAVAARMTGLLVASVLLLGIGILAAELFRFTQVPSAAAQEPFALTFFPQWGAQRTQSTITEGASVLDRREASLAAAYQADQGARKRNVILIVGDAARADRMQIYGHERPTTPNLVRLASEQRANVAIRMTSACSESYCGLMSLARSKFVHQFSRSSLSLPDVLRRHGYQVRFILGGDHTNFYGLKDAYGSADEYYDGASDTGYMNDDWGLLKHVASMPDWSGSPQFIQFHLMSTHGLGKRHDEFNRYLPAMSYYGPAWKLRAGGDEVQVAGNYYDNGMLQFDHVVSELIATLGSKGYLRDAIVVVTGDHGEMLGEHDEYSHAASVSQPALGIPFIMFEFGDTARMPWPARRSASQVDIAPTILAALSMPIPEGWQGIPMQTTTDRSLVYFQQGMQAGLVDDSDPDALWKFWIDERNHREYAFDLLGDAGEITNRAASVDIARLAAWRQALVQSRATLIPLEAVLGSDALPMEPPPRSD